MAHRSGVPCAIACAGAPPLRPKSVDLVLVSQLRRSPMARLAFWVGAHALRFDATTMADGITSLRRGFTAAELHALLRAAGIRARVSCRPGYRLVATWRTGSAPAGLRRPEVAR
jgi:hypothetical protein